MGNSEVIARILDNLRGRLDDLRRRVGYLEANAEGPSDLEMWERLTTYHHGGAAAITDHFGGAALSSSWTWAGAPFVTPTVSLADSILNVSFGAGAGRGFAYQAVTASNKLASVALWSMTVGFAAGLRLDDGTDNNYAEVVLRVSQASPTQWAVQGRYRVGGGAVATVDGDAISEPDLYVLYTVLSGALWARWYFRPFLRGPHAGLMWKPNSYAVGLPAAWTPTRAGLIFDNTAGASSGERAYVDWCDLSA